MGRFALLLILLLAAQPLFAADDLDQSHNSAHGPMCGADCRAGVGLGHSASSPLEYGSQPASRLGTGTSDGMRPDRCRMPCRYTSSCCFHRVRTSQEDDAGPRHPCRHPGDPPA